MAKKLALCMIVKPTDDEAVLLERCLKSAKPFVHDIFLTITGSNVSCRRVGEKFGATLSSMPWEGNFAKARTYNFSQAKKADYILWLDCDDQLVGGNNLARVVESMDERGVKGVYAQYLYDFDKDGNVTVQHPKTRIIRNDGSFEWAHQMGELHEDLQPTYKCPTAFLDKKEESCYFEVHHKTTPERVEGNMKRNLSIAEKQLRDHPEDPRAIWNVANCLSWTGDLGPAYKLYERFVELSGSDDERYLAFHRMAAVKMQEGKYDKAEKDELKAVALFPWYPDAYIGLGNIYYKQEKWKHAKEFLIQGMSKDPSDYQIVQNPRDYDQNPMMLLANCYFNMGKPKECKQVLTKLVEMFPKDTRTKKMLDAVEITVKDQEEVDDLLVEAGKLTKIQLAAALEALDDRMKMHPQVCILRNENFKRDKTPGNEIAYYCGFTEERWDRSSERTGIGGSEEAVLHLSKRWQKAGKQVVIYNNCGSKEFMDEFGVMWRPYWTFNPRDKYDTLILWRSPALADRRLNATRVLVDMHDVLDSREFTTTRLANIDVVYVKSDYHRSLFPNVPDSKIRVLGNGIDLTQFEGQEKRVPQSLIYTSSADRGLEHLLDSWPKLKKDFPKATLNIYYGWGVFDSVHKTDPVMMKWKQDMIKKMKHIGITVHGRVGHKEIARRMMQSDIYAYPCHFEEIDCISFKKAVAAGCRIVSTNYAALSQYEDASAIEKGMWDTFEGEVAGALEGKVAKAKEDPTKWSWNNIAKVWSQNFT